ncbi:MAG: hypothetical protein OEW15_12595 [Nitrospirota bacterium]|nr:hypothetical protein [Nitrospirota bacterium]
MRRTFICLILLSFFLPVQVRAGIIGTPDPVEDALQKRIEKQKNFIQRPDRSDSERMTDEFQENMKTAEVSQTGEKKSGSVWWKWALGILVVGGIAAAASGGGGSGGGSSSSTGATVTGSW